MSDVFISHSSKDKEIADKVVKFFEDKGLSCWIAPRDIVPGTEWPAETAFPKKLMLMAASESMKAFLPIISGMEKLYLLIYIPMEILRVEL
ncbi:MAG: toll/interleukin-1 receptor domain-containing protein [Lachnospiraceae bacterium]|nr:toll/interleukin-1 receptor domain-containing protein [Lachnospiraceae bacterium]